MPELSRLWPLKTGTPLLNTLLGSGCEMGVPKLSCCTCCWYCASCCCWKWSCEWSCECIRGYACCCSNEGASISEQNFCYCSMPESSPILPQRSKANHRPLPTPKKHPNKKKKKESGLQRQKERTIFLMQPQQRVQSNRSPQRSSPPPPRFASRALLSLACDASLTPWVTVARLLQSCPSAERQPRKIFYTEDRSLPFPTPQSLTLFSSDDPLLIRRLPVLL